LSYFRNITIGLIIIVIGLAGILSYNYLSIRTISIDGAEMIAERHLESINEPDLDIREVMEFEYNFYVVYYERSTGIGAFEMLIDRESGRIFPEYGPNMMWNTKYGHGGMMGGQGGMGGVIQPPSSGELIEEEAAIEIAQVFLDEVYPGSKAEDPHPFYGYYTLHTTKDGEIFGMLSVNMYSGAVWYHNWHGDYIRSRESH